MSYPQVVLSSRNQKKIAEMRDLLSPHGLSLIGVEDFQNVPEVVEDGQTFAENAAKKAVQTARHLGMWTIGEDSGLLVDALNGEPGVYSARYSGEQATDESNNAKLIEKLQGIPMPRRTAGYRCHVAVSDPDGVVRASFEDQCRGVILEERRGAHGFGYDPYFLVPEFHQTFGELSLLVKQQISHRGRAFRRLIPILLKLLSVETTDP